MQIAILGWKAGQGWIANMGEESFGLSDTGHKQFVERGGLGEKKRAGVRIRGVLALAFNQ